MAPAESVSYSASVMDTLPVRVAPQRGPGADIRMAQYESGTRTPKADVTEALAQALEVSPAALAVPDIDTNVGLMHTLFVLEDLRGLKVGQIDGELCLRLDKHKGSEYISMFDMLSAWYEQEEKYRNGEITKEEYDRWRYNYSKYDTSGHLAKLPSQEISDLFTN